MVPAAFDILVRAMVLLTAAWIATTLLRRRSASFRAMVWTLALGGAVMLPALMVLTPDLPVPLWRTAATVETAAPSRPEFVPPIAGPAAFDGPIVSTDAVAVSPADGSSQPDAVPAPAASWSIASIVLPVWILGSVACLGRLGVSHWRLARITRAPLQQAADGGAIEAIVDEARQRLGIRRRVAVRSSEALNVPIVTGVLRPALVLPAEASAWKAGVLRAVVSHELAHVARWDALGQLVSQAACAAYWFVPLIWVGARRAEALREQAADNVVLQSGVRASAYADTLLNVARLAGGFTSGPAVLAMAHPDRIRERIVAILDARSCRDGLGVRTVVGVAGIALGTLLLLSAVQPVVRAAGREAVIVTAPLPPRVAAQAPAAQAVAAGPCGKDLKQSSSSVNDDGRTRLWTVRLSNADCKVDMRAEGRVEFNADFTDIAGLSAGGIFRLDVTEGRVRKELELRQRGGTLERTWRVDGRERPFDAEGRAWLAGFLIELDRRMAIGVDHRLPRLLEAGGVTAVLDETALMTGDFARSRYYEKLLSTTTLTSADLTRLAAQANALLKSDHYADELVTNLAKQPAVTPEVRAAVLTIIEGMASDHYKAHSIEVVVGRGRPSAADMDFLVRTLAGVKSDHYKGEVLETILRGDLEPAHRSVLAQVARTIKSDHYASQFLIALVDEGALSTDAGRDAFFQGVESLDSDHYVLEVIDAVTRKGDYARQDVPFVLRAFATLESDHYRGEVLARLLRSTDLAADDLLRIVTAAGVMKSDHYKSEALQRAGRHAAANDRVRQAVLDAADGLSNHYYGLVSRAVRR